MTGKRQWLRSHSTTHTAHADEIEGADMATALYYHPAAGKESLCDGTAKLKL